MKNQNAFYLFLSLTLPFGLFGQTVSIGGNLNISADNNTSKSESFTIIEKSKAAFFSPACHFFLTRKLMVGGGLTVGGSDYEFKAIDFEILERKFFSRAIAPSIRYYFFDKSRWAFFGAFDFKHTQSKESTEHFFNGQVMQEKTTTSITNYTPSVGANYALASDIALEIKLFSDHTFYNTNNRPLNLNYSGLNLTFQNFLTIPQKGKTANQPLTQYLRKGKWLVDGGIYIARAGLITQKSNKISGTLNPTIGYFLNKNIVLGINSRYSNSISQINSGEAGRWNLEPFARFYQRTLPRFYLFGESRLLFFSYSLITNGVEKQKIQSELAFNLGYNYFLSQHISLEGLFYHFNYSKTATLIGTTREHEFGLKAKVRYFLN